MQSQNRLFDDLARVASGAAGALTGVRREIEELFRQRLERYLAEADIVTRDEFDAIKAVAVRAREAQEALDLGLLRDRRGDGRLAWHGDALLRDAEGAPRSAQR